MSNSGGYSRELFDCTLVRNDTRAVYNANVRYHAGYHVSGYTLRVPKNDRLLGVANRTEAVLVAQRMGLETPARAADHAP